MFIFLSWQRDTFYFLNWSCIDRVKLVKGLCRFRWSEKIGTFGGPISCIVYAPVGVDCVDVKVNDFNFSLFLVSILFISPIAYQQAKMLLAWIFETVIDWQILFSWICFRHPTEFFSVGFWKCSKDSQTLNLPPVIWFQFTPYFEWHGLL